MTAIVVPFMVEVTWSGTYGPRPWANVMHFLLDESDPAARNTLLPGVAQACADAWVDNLSPRLSDELLMTNVRAQDLDSLAGQIVNLTTSDAGGQSGASLPPGVAMLVTKDTTHPRTARNGRWFQSGILEGDTDNPAVGALNAAGVAAWQTAFTDFLNQVNDPVIGTNNTPMVLSKSSAPSGFTPYLIQFLTVNALLATQRRRQRK